MPLSRETAQLYDAVQRNPHETLIWEGPDSTLHLAFYTVVRGWFTPCGRQLHEQQIGRLRYGRPTCFECFIDDKDPRRLPQTMMKLRVALRGQHKQITVFMGRVNETLVNLGSLTLEAFEYREYIAAVVLGGKLLGMKVVVEEEP